MDTKMKNGDERGKEDPAEIRESEFKDFCNPLLHSLISKEFQRVLIPIINPALDGSLQEMPKTWIRLKS